MFKHSSCAHEIPSFHCQEILKEIHVLRAVFSITSSRLQVYVLELEMITGL